MLADTPAFLTSEELLVYLPPTYDLLVAASFIYTDSDVVESIAYRPVSDSQLTKLGAGNVSANYRF
jgi:hypothetical protein